METRNASQQRTGSSHDERKSKYVIDKMLNPYIYKCQFCFHETTYKTRFCYGCGLITVRDRRAVGAKPISMGEVARKTDGRCFYCGVQLTKLTATRDHVVPRSKGGLNTATNLVLACGPCNHEKGNLNLDEYRAAKEVSAFYGEINGRTTRP